MELPYNLEAEKQVLANMLFSHTVLVDTLARLDENDFYLKEHQIIFTALKDIFESGIAKIEPIALIDKLSNDGNLAKVGDASYIMELVDSYIDISNAKYYINTVEERSILRKIINHANKVCEKWQQESAGDITSYINKVERELTDITKKRRVEDFVSISSAFEQYKNHVKSLKSGQGMAEGLLTGYNHFDNLLLGFKPGEIYILSARPSVGKSALALNFLYKVALKTKKPCVFFSLEMSIDSVTNRILSAKSGVPIRKIQTATFDREEESALNKAMRDLSETNLYIDDTAAIKASEMRSKLNKLQSRHGEIGLIVVDYIGLMSPDIKGKRQDNRSLEIGEMSAALKAISRDYKAPILVLAQLNRNVDGRKDQKPQLSDLRESGSLEQDADVVMFIHRPDYGKSEDTNTDPTAESDSPVSLNIEKNRNGRTASINFMFQKHIGRFVEIDEER